MFEIDDFLKLFNFSKCGFREINSSKHQTAIKFNVLNFIDTKKY